MDEKIEIFYQKGKCIMNITYYRISTNINFRDTIKNNND